MYRSDIVAIGDSLTWGYPFGPEASWLHLAAGATGLKMVNKGINGQTTGEMRARFDADVINLKPEVVTILGGTNDAWAVIGASEVKKNILAMVNKAHQAGIGTVVVLPPPICHGGGEIPLDFMQKMADLLGQYREEFRELAAVHGSELLDFYTPLLNRETGWGREEYFVDAGHPNRRGYKVMAETAVELFKRLPLRRLL